MNSRLVIRSATSYVAPVTINSAGLRAAHEVVEPFDDTLGRTDELLAGHAAGGVGVGMGRRCVGVDERRAVVGADAVAQDAAGQGEVVGLFVGLGGERAGADDQVRLGV